MEKEKSFLISLSYGEHNHLYVHFRLTYRKCENIIKIKATCRSKTNKLRNFLRFCPNKDAEIKKTLQALIKDIEPVIGDTLALPLDKVYEYMEEG